MNRLLICLFASIALVCAQSTNNGTGASSTTTTTTTTSTTISPTNVTTVTSTPTTNKTEAPITTSTTPKPDTTTTAKPKTTTVAPPNPPPVPKPETFKGNVTEGNQTCINVEFSVQITIKYNNTNNEEKTTGFTIPSNASIDLKSSKCSEDPKNPKPEIIVIRFDENKAEHTSANMTLIFNKTSDGSVFVEEVELSFVATEDLMPGLDSKLYGKTMSSAKNELSLFKVASVHSYVCSAAQSAKLDSHEDRITGVQIEFTDSKVEAYINESNKGKFDSEIDCKSADISDVVPIAVGAALAGLVVIVLIAYFIGRRRSRRLAYQSV